MNNYTQEQIKEILKSNGLNLTLSRISLCSFIFNASHPTSDDVLNWAKQNLPKTNVSSVYNTLNDLEQVGLIKKIKFEHLKHFVYDNNVNHHHHFLDEKSGQIIDLKPEDIQIKISPSLQKKLKIKGTSLIIKGQRV